VAVPAMIDDKLVAVLYAEDARVGRFSEIDVHCLQIIASQLAAHMAHAAEDDVVLDES
jgi:GAF domain-containing protein